MRPPSSASRYDSRSRVETSNPWSRARSASAASSFSRSSAICQLDGPSKYRVFCCEQRLVTVVFLLHPREEIRAVECAYVARHRTSSQHGRHLRTLQSRPRGKPLREAARVMELLSQETRHSIIQALLGHPETLASAAEINHFIPSKSKNPSKSSWMCLWKRISLGSTSIPQTRKSVACRGNSTALPSMVSISSGISTISRAFQWREPFTKKHESPRKLSGTKRPHDRPSQNQSVQRSDSTEKRNNGDCLPLVEIAVVSSGTQFPKSLTQFQSVHVYFVQFR